MRKLSQLEPMLSAVLEQVRGRLAALKFDRAHFERKNDTRLLVAAVVVGAGEFDVDKIEHSFNAADLALLIAQAYTAAGSAGHQLRSAEFEAYAINFTADRIADGIAEAYDERYGL